jgi:hypothetical protein
MDRIPARRRTACSRPAELRLSLAMDASPEMIERIYSRNLTVAAFGFPGQKSVKNEGGSVLGMQFSVDSTQAIR